MEAGHRFRLLLLTRSDYRSRMAPGAQTVPALPATSLLGKDRFVERPAFSRPYRNQEDIQRPHAGVP